MEHFAQEIESNLQRIGFHYPQDGEGYSLSDARNWVKQLKRLGANWLLLINPAGRAIPEDFIRYLDKNSINLIMHFAKNIGEYEDISEIEILIQVYAKWGVKYASLFEHPNMRQRWGDTKWGKENVVETHALFFLEFANKCTSNGIVPILSPLFPGGDYWDLAFFENTLKFIQQKTNVALFSNLCIAAFGWHHQHPLDWGAGGRDKWPNASPFASNQDSQDQRGFRLYEWYTEICLKILGKKLPIIIFEAGDAGSELNGNFQTGVDWSQYLDQVMRLLAGENVYDLEKPDQLLSSIESEVIACCFSIPVGTLQNTAFTTSVLSSQTSINEESESANPLFSEKEITNGGAHPYRRYIYIDHPLRYETPTILESIDHYIKKHKPYIGFSLVEGCKSAYLIVITDDKDKFASENHAFLTEANIVKMLLFSELSLLDG